MFEGNKVSDSVLPVLEHFSRYICYIIELEVLALILQHFNKLKLVVFI